MSTNKPMFGPVVLEITCDIFINIKMNTNKPMFGPVVLEMVCDIDKESSFQGHSWLPF